MTPFPTCESPVASIIIPTCDNLDMLATCLRSLRASIDPEVVPYEVIVMFQQMGATAVKNFCTRFAGIRSIEVRLNLGFGAANNYAAKHARGEFLILLNDDTKPQLGWLEALVACANTDPAIGIVGSRLVYMNYTLQEAGSVMWSDGTAACPGRGEPIDTLSYSYVRDVDYSSANGMLVRRSTFDALGGFDERYYPGYYEDADLCFAVRYKLGQRVLYEPRSVVLHVESASLNRDVEFRHFLFRRHKALFCKKWKDVLATSYSPPDPSPEALERALLRHRGKAGRVLIVDDRLPDPGVGAGGAGSGFVRARDLFEELALSDFSVAFYPSNKAVRIFENPLAGLGVDIIAEYLDQHLARSKKTYDVVVISRPHNYRFVFEKLRSRFPEAVFVYDVEALYHKRLAIEAELAAGTPKQETILAEAVEMERLERAIAHSVDVVVAISDEERAWLEQIDGHARIEFMRPLLSGITLTTTPYESRKDAVFVAGWLAGDASPNVDGLVWFTKNVMPHVRKALPDFQLLVTGNDPPLRVQSLAGNGIVLTGFVESIEQLYAQARIAIAPIRAGAGVKNKTMEALQYGVPVVATTVGAEGLGMTDGRDIDIADDPAEFAQRMVALLSQPHRWLSTRRELEATVRKWLSERTAWHHVLERALDSKTHPDDLEEYTTKLELREIELNGVLRRLQDEWDARKGSRKTFFENTSSATSLSKALPLPRLLQGAPRDEAYIKQLQARIGELESIIHQLTS